MRLGEQAALHGAVLLRCFAHQWFRCKGDAKAARVERAAGIVRDLGDDLVTFTAKQRRAVGFQRLSRTLGQARHHVARLERGGQMHGKVDADRQPPLQCGCVVLLLLPNERQGYERRVNVHRRTLRLAERSSLTAEGEVRAHSLVGVSAGEERHRASRRDPGRRERLTEQPILAGVGDIDCFPSRDAAGGHGAGDRPAAAGQQHGEPARGACHRELAHVHRADHAVAVAEHSSPLVAHEARRHLRIQGGWGDRLRSFHEPDHGATQGGLGLGSLTHGPSSPPHVRSCKAHETI